MTSRSLLPVQDTTPLGQITGVGEPISYGSRSRSDVSFVGAHGHRAGSKADAV